MNEAWLLQTAETRRPFARATWVPLRAYQEDKKHNVRRVGHTSDLFACGSVAFPKEHRELAERLGWSQIGIGHSVAPYAYEDGYYASVEQYQYNDKEPVGVNLVFEHPQPVVGGKQWILNPDLVIALRLIKDGRSWVRPEEDFAVVAREVVGTDGSHSMIEIKREFLIDYLAARGLSLRLAYYRQRVENVSDLATSPYAKLADTTEDRDSGRFETRLRTLNDVFGGNWAMFRVWRTDVDEEDDAPTLGPETNENTASESSQGNGGGFPGVRVEGEFWREEWIEHQGISVRVRGDADTNLPQFIVETDGSRKPSAELNDEDVGRWLWFRSGVINELLTHKGVRLKWYTAETGAIVSTSGHSTHFGINAADLITVYAHDVARLPSWKQHLWAAHNLVPDGKLSVELYAAQVKTRPAETHAVEELLFASMRLLEDGFQNKFGVRIFSHDIDDEACMQQVSRFASRDEVSLLRLAKDLVRVFSDRLDVRSLRKLSTHADKDKLASNKLLQDVLAQKVGEEQAGERFRVVAGTYDMRVGDAHPTSSKIAAALKLADVDSSRSHLRQGEQLIHNFGQAIWLIGRHLFGDKSAAESEPS
jgi:hypothetical protein